MSVKHSKVLSSSLNYFNPNNLNDKKLLQPCILTIKNTIKKINLDLTDLTVLTEAASGYWLFLPLIAALANSKQVLCYTKTTKYGTSKQIMKNFKNLSKFLGLEEKILVFNKLDRSIIKQADIITNSGHLRPINSKFLTNVKNTAVISLMWEPWEFRKTDLDINFCWKHGISILGTNEHNSVINVMSYAGDLLQKILVLKKITVKNKQVILVGENISSLYIYKKLLSLGATVNCISKHCKKEFMNINAKIIGAKLNDPAVDNYIKNADLIIIASIPIQEKIIGGPHGISVKKLQKLNPKIKILVYHGNVNYSQLQSVGIPCYPKTQPALGHMGWTADTLGPKVTIETLALGLKTGEILANLRKTGLSPRKAELEAIKTPFCLDFPYSIKKLKNNES